MARGPFIGNAIGAASLLALAVLTWAPSPAAAGPFSVWRASSGAITATFVRGTGYAVAGVVSPEPSTGRPRSRIVLVDAESAREVWSADYRNSNCCGTPAVGVLARGRRVFASGDELLSVPLSGGASKRVELDGVTLDAAATAEQVLAGVVRVRPGSVEYEVVAVGAGGVRWRAPHRDLTAVALSADGLAAAASPRAIRIFDAETGRLLRQIDLTETRFADLAFFPGGLLAVARKTTAGDLRIMGIDARTGGRRWTLSLGPTTVPTVEVVGRLGIVGDFRGRLGAVIGLSGEVQRHWTDAQGPIFVAGSPRGDVAVAIGPSVVVRSLSGEVRWRAAIPGTVLGLRLDGVWLAAIGTADEKSGRPDRVWFARTNR